MCFRRILRVFQGLPLLVRTRFQVLFHSPSGVLFAFPSRYWFTIGQLGVFSLGGWSPLATRLHAKHACIAVQTGFHVSRPTRFHLKAAFAYGTFTHYGVPFQTLLLTDQSA